MITPPAVASNSKLSQTDINESQKILDTRPDSAGPIVSKSPDNITSINNYGVNSINTTDETVLQVSTSPENSSFNNQGTKTLSEFYINAINTNQKAEPERISPVPYHKLIIQPKLLNH